MALWFRWRFVGPTLAVAWAAYLGVLHPWLMNWGATPEEVAMTLPGDDLAPRPVSFFTRAITIEAPPSSVWPWILQIGQDRAGFYSYTWLENLTGADIHTTPTRSTRSGRRGRSGTGSPWRVPISWGAR